MAFLDDIFGAFTGQQAAPQQTIIPTSDLLGQAYGAATAAAPGVIAYNRALAPGLTEIQQGVQEQIFGPAAGALQKGYYQSVLDQLNLGGTVPQDLQDLITTNTLQQLGRSGVGATDLGKIFGARSLLSAGLDLAGQRRAEAGGAVGQLPLSRYTYQADRGFTPSEIGADIRGVQAAQDEYKNLQEDIRRQNFSSLLNTGGRILGTAAGAFGGPLGASIGGSIGGSLFQGSRVGGRPQIGGPQYGIGGGNLNILSSLFGGGGGQFVPGMGGRPDAVTAGGLPFGGLFI